ncbi:MAG: hypothetical protein Q9162_001007 [Coniocarpon cinnabarinum]
MGTAMTEEYTDTPFKPEDSHQIMQSLIEDVARFDAGTEGFEEMLKARWAWRKPSTEVATGFEKKHGVELSSTWNPANMEEVVKAEYDFEEDDQVYLLQVPSSVLDSVDRAYFERQLIETQSRLHTDLRGGRVRVVYGGDDGLGDELTQALNMLDSMNTMLNRRRKDPIGLLHELAYLGKSFEGFEKGLFDFLLLRGSDVNKRSSASQTPLHLAAQMGSDKVVELLINHGARVDVRLNTGETALHIAAAHGHPKIVNFLLVNGADIHAKNVSNFTVAWNLFQDIDDDTAYIAYEARHGVESITNPPVLLAGGLEAPEGAVRDGDHWRDRPLTPTSIIIREGRLELEAGWHEIFLLFMKLIPGETKLARQFQQGGDTLLHAVAKQSKKEALCLILNHFEPGEINVRGSMGRTALWYAVYNGYHDVAHMLVDGGADAELQSYFPGPSSPIHTAIAQGDVNMVRLLTSNGAGRDMRSEHEPLLVWTIRVAPGMHLVNRYANHGLSLEQLNDPAVNASTQKLTLLHVKCFIDNDFDVNEQNNRGSTALHEAARKGLTEICDALLVAGASVDVRDAKGFTPALYAALQGHHAARWLDILRLLISHDDPTKIATGLKRAQGDTLVHAAAVSGSEPMLDMLLANITPAQTDTRGMAGRTPLVCAVQFHHHSCARKLIAHGANVNLKVPRDTTALEYAVICDATDMVRLLMHHGARLTCKMGMPILHWTIRPFPGLLISRNGRLEQKKANEKTDSIVQALLDAGADPTEKGAAGCTALHYAAGDGLAEVCDALIRTGADVNARDADGDAALVWAIQSNRKAVVAILLDAGADCFAPNWERKTSLDWAGMVGNLDMIEIIVEWAEGVVGN